MRVGQKAIEVCWFPGMDDDTALPANSVAEYTILDKRRRSLRTDSCTQEGEESGLKEDKTKNDVKEITPLKSTDTAAQVSLQLPSSIKSLSLGTVANNHRGQIITENSEEGMKGAGGPDDQYEAWFRREAVSLGFTLERGRVEASTQTEESTEEEEEEEDDEEEEEKEEEKKKRKKMKKKKMKRRKKMIKKKKKKMKKNRGIQEKEEEE